MRVLKSTARSAVSHTHSELHSDCAEMLKPNFRAGELHCSSPLVLFRESGSNILGHIAPTLLAAVVTGLSPKKLDPAVASTPGDMVHF